MAALHQTLVELRAQAPDPETMGASEKLTVAKHQLRDWIEGQLGALDNEEDTKAFEVRINQTLKQIDAGGPEEGQNRLGSINEVRFGGEGGLLIVTTGVGISCQYDESAYAYKRVDGRWKRVWEAERLPEGKVSPQVIDAVHVWQDFKDGHEEGPPYVMTLGNYWGCASMWRSVNYRIWRIGSAGSKLLIDRTEPAYLGQVPIVGAIGKNYGEKAVNVLVEFNGDSIDTGILVRRMVRHFLIDGDRVTRVDPVALSPRDFVDEWMTRPWEESAGWSASADLRRWHGKLHSDFVRAGSARRCIAVHPIFGR